MRTSRTALSTLLLLAIWTAPLDAQRARLVADLDTDADPSPDGFSEALVFFDGRLYFWGSDPLTGTELRRSHGAAGATVLVKDICPGECSARPGRVEAAVLGDRFFFTACDPARGCHLWKSDGTSDGTEIVEAFNVDDGPDSRFRPSRLTAWNDSLYFFADDPVLGVELFRSDGTAEGTAVVKDIRPGRERVLGGQIVPTDDELFLLTAGEVWTSDGTEEGTRLVATLPEGRQADPERSKALGDLVFMPVSERLVPSELWRSDGTAEGTFRLRTATANVWIPDIVPLDDQVLFFEVSDREIQLWRTDGTSEGTSRVAGGFAYVPNSVAAYRGEAYFTGLNTLWRSDGTSRGTRMVRRFDKFISDLLVVGDTLFVQLFSVGDTEIWRTAGTSESTELVLGPSFGSYEGLIAHGDRLAVEVRREGAGVELAIVDEAAATVSFLTDAVDPGSGDPRDVTARAGRLLFAAGDGVYAVTAGGSPPELLASFPRAPEIVQADGGVFIFAGGLWFLDDRSDRPVELLRDRSEGRLDAELAVARGGELFFLVRVPDTLTHELYRSDGTPAGTVFAAAGLPPLPFCIDFGCRNESVDIDVLGSSVLVVHDTVLARADFETRSFEALFDAAAVPGCSGQTVDDAVAFCEVGHLTPAADRVFFTAGGNAEPIVLWTSDGTPEGTAAVRELHPAPAGFGFEQPRSPRELTAVGDRLFFVLRDPEHGEELWTSDGTEPGTVLVRDIRPGPWSSFPSSLAAFDGRLVFGADDGVFGHELWASDGTAPGTALVADVFTGRGSSFPGPFTTLDGRLVFGASSELRGREPWTSDLTAAGTRQIADLRIASGSSNPREFAAFGNLVYMNADNGFTGAELYAFPRAALETPGECRSCLLRELFEVRVDWVGPGGAAGTGHAVPYDDNNLFFWFFGPQNLELLVKVLDGVGVNGHYWVFYGALSNVEYTVTVENRWTGEIATYHNPAGNLCGGGDTQAFPDHDGRGGGAVGSPKGLQETAADPKGACVPGDRTLCLLGGRFRVDVDWTDPGGVAGSGRAVPLTAASGAYWFFAPNNLELMVKVLDGRGVNGRFWFFYGGLSSVEYEITVTDTVSGEVRLYRNDPGEVCGLGDTAAFGGG